MKKETILLLVFVMFAVVLTYCIKLEKHIEVLEAKLVITAEYAKRLGDTINIYHPEPAIPIKGWHALNGGPCRCPPGKCPFEENREFQFFPTNPPQVISEAIYDKSRGVKWGDGYLYPLKKRSAQ